MSEHYDPNVFNPLKPTTDELLEQIDALTIERDALRKQLGLAREAMDDYIRNKSIIVLYDALAALDNTKSNSDITKSDGEGE
jgi:hypothetical protein